MPRKNTDRKWSLILFALYIRGVHPLIPVPLWEDESFWFTELHAFFFHHFTPTPLPVTGLDVL
jgi:hypothetical protein